MSAKVRTENVTDWAGLWMRVDDFNSELIAFDNMQNRPIKGTRDWQPYEIVLDVPSESERIAAGILVSGAGKAWISDVHFTPVSKQIPTTDISRLSQ
jgi:hypothetical protein